jgi:hypothetical protein
VVYSVEAKIEEFDVKKQNAGTTTLTSPQNTKNSVDVVPIKKTQVEKVAKTTRAIDTVTLKTETTNKFKNQYSLRSAPTTDFSKNADVETDARARVERAARHRYTPSPELPQTRIPSRSRSSTSSRTTLPRSALTKSPKLAQIINLF